MLVSLTRMATLTHILYCIALKFYGNKILRQFASKLFRQKVNFMEAQSHAQCHGEISIQFTDFNFMVLPLIVKL